MAKKFPHQQVFFASWSKPKDVKNLSDLLVSTSRLINLWHVFSQAHLSVIRRSKEKSICFRNERSRHWHAKCWQVHTTERASECRHVWPYVLHITNLLAANSSISQYNRNTKGISHIIQSWTHPCYFHADETIRESIGIFIRLPWRNVTFPRKWAQRCRTRR